MNNRFTVQVLGNVDYAGYSQLQAKILEVLNSIEGFKITTCNLTAWQDGNGKLREFNEDGSEYFEPTTEPETSVDDEDEQIQIEEVTEEVSKEENTEEKASEQ